MKETFSKLLYDVQWHTDVLQSILEVDFGDSGITFEPEWCIGELRSRDELSLLKAMRKDVKVLTGWLRSLKLDDPTEKDLANRFLEKTQPVEDQISLVALEGSYQPIENRAAEEQSAEFDEDSNGVGLVTQSFNNLLYLNPQHLINRLDGISLGEGSGGQVRETTLLGGNFAVKIFDLESAPSFDKEMAAIQGLGHHPHIVRLLCYSRNNNGCFLVMERMDKDLTRFLQLRKDNCKLSGVEAVVLMLQIAEGVRYIYSMHMAHRDLKPGNVLVNLEDPSNKSSRTRSVKIADFGLTKTKNASRTYADQTWNTGTSRYMAPEVAKEKDEPAKRAKFNLMKADVYSFGIMCSEILTGENPFGEAGQRPIELKKKVKAGDRPNLPENCPLRLKALIQSCWAHYFHVRPLFPEICKELRYIKGLLLRGDQQKLESEFVSNVERQGEQFPDVAASTKGIRQGPWGRNQPDKKVGLFDDKADSIKSIKLKYNQNPPGLGLMEVEYVKPDGEEFTGRYSKGIIGIEVVKIDFKPGEYIIRVSGSIDRHVVTHGTGTVAFVGVVPLTIHTTHGSYGPFGDEVGKPFTSGTGKVIGFSGAAVLLLDRLGVWTIPDGQDDGDECILIQQ